MEDVELIMVGVFFAVGLVLVEHRIRMPARTLLNIALVVLTGLLLWLLGISIVTNAMDFAQADVGVFLGAGMMESWLHLS